jgi:hypothetical protein
LNETRFPFNSSIALGRSYLACDLPFHDHSLTVGRIQQVDPFFVFGLLLRSVDRSLLLIDISDKDINLFPFFDLPRFAEGGEFPHWKDPFRLITDIDKDLALVHLNNRSGDRVPPTVHLDIAFRESVFHLN